MPNIDEKTKKIEVERTIGKGKLTINDVGFGQIIGVYRIANVWDILKRTVKSNLSKLKKGLNGMK